MIFGIGTLVLSKFLGFGICSTTTVNRCNYLINQSLMFFLKLSIRVSQKISDAITGTVFSNRGPANMETTNVRLSHVPKMSSLAKITDVYRCHKYAMVLMIAKITQHRTRPIRVVLKLMHVLCT